MNLTSLEASDMLDVIHFLLEKEFIGEYVEASEVRHKTRTFIYEDLYGKPYLMRRRGQAEGEDLGYGNEGVSTDASGRPIAVPMDDEYDPNGTSGGGYGNFSGGSAGRPLAPGTKHMSATPHLTSKPYIPPTDMNMTDNPFQPFPRLKEQPQF